MCILDAVLLDPINRPVVGLVPKAALRELFLSVKDNTGVRIFALSELTQTTPSPPKGRGGVNSARNAGCLF